VNFNAKGSWGDAAAAHHKHDANAALQASENDAKRT
jgi:hypothetical protein